MVVETTVKNLSSPFRGLGGSTVHRALCIVNLLIALSFGFSQQAWAYDISAGVTIYYDNLISNYSSPYMTIRKGDGNQYDYDFARIGTTTFYYKYFSSKWEGYDGIWYRNSNWSPKSSYEKYSISQNCVIVGKGSTEGSGIGMFTTYKKAYPNTRIYWDNSQTDANWSKVYLRYGFDCVNHAHEFKKFPGTTNLYYIDVPEAYYGKYTVSNNCGYTNANNVDQPSSSVKPTGTYAITKQLEYSATDINNGNSVSTFTISGVHGTSYDCTFYDYNISHGIPQHTVTIKKLTHGTITASYYGTDGNQYNSESKTDADHVIYVPRTGQVKITLTTDNGYSGTLTVGGSAFTSGNTYTVTSDITISANVTPNKTTVTFAKNDGSESSFNVNVAYDSRDRIVVPNTSDTTRTGYTFNNYWTTTSGGTESNNKMTSLINSGQLYFVNASRTDYLTSGKWTKDGGTATFYAHWSAKTYDIILKAGDYPNTTDGSAKVTFDGASLTNMTKPTRTGYNIAGTNAFCSDAACTKQVATGGGALKKGSDYTYSDKDNWNYDATGTVTLYTNWTARKCTLQLNNMSADILAGDAQKVVTYDASPTKITAPEKTNKVFAGYFTQDGSTSGEWGVQIIGDDGSFIANVTDYLVGGKWAYSGELTEITLYAKWNEPQPKKVYFGITDGTNTTDERGSISASYMNGETPIAITSGETPVPFGKAVTITWTNSIQGTYYPTNKAYESGNWYNKANISDAATQLKTGTNYYTVTIAATDINAYVYAKPVLHDITVPEVEHGTASADPTQAGPHFRSTLTATPASGYDFTGWTIDNADNGKFVDEKTASDATTYVAAKAAVTVTPSYTIHSYSITYHGLQEGDVNNNPETYTIETATIDLADAYRAGYTFDGWYDAETEGKQVTFIELGSMGDKTLWARWHQTDFTVDVVVNDANGGSIITPESSPITAHYMESFLIKAEENGGYDFTGWTVSPQKSVDFGSYDVWSALTASRKLANSGVELSEASDKTLTSSATIIGDDNTEITITANFEEVMSAVTISSNNTDYGTVNVNSASVGVTTTQELTATNEYGYKFKEWDLQGGVVLATGTKTNATITIKGDGNGTAGTAQAIFEEDLSTPWRLNYGVDGQSGWQQPNFVKRTGESTGKIAYVSVELTGGTTYHFNYVTGESTYKGPENDHAEMPANTEWTFNYAQRAKFIAGVSGTYTFKIDYSNNDNPKASYETPSTSGIKGDWTGWAHENGTVEDNVLTYTHTFEAGDVKSQAFKVVFNGVFFGAENAENNMTRQNSSDWTLTSTSGGNNINLNVDMAGEYTFTYNSTTNKLSVTYPGEEHHTVIVDNGETQKDVEVKEVTETPLVASQYLNGMRFDRWVVTNSEGVVQENKITINTPTSCSTHMHGATEDGLIVKATYTSHGIIYFKNNPGWSEVKVYFYEGQYFDQTFGTGCLANGDEGMRKANGYGMTHLANTDIWYYDWQSAGLHPNQPIVAFTVNLQTKAQWFDENQVVYRGDWHDEAPLFVPYNYIHRYLNKHDSKQTCYYDEGLWMKYNSTESGYDIRGNWGTTTWKKQDAQSFKATSAGGYEFFTEMIQLPADEKEFKIYLDPKTEGAEYNTFGTAQGKGNKISSATPYTKVYENTGNAYIQPTAAAGYIFKLSLGDGQIIVSVEYPLSPGDYQVVSVTDGKYHSNGIIYKQGAEASLASFFIEKGKTTALKLQKCSTIVANEPVWENTSVTYTIPSTMATGIYNFRINPLATNPTIENLNQKYSGKYYIRTDGVDGGWESYQTNADNEMYDYGSMLDAGVTYGNFPYDYYKTKWIPKDKNVKFTIANDYSKCISDSLVGDAIIGNEVMTLPEKANVRFMWNSATNQLSRAYISGSTNIADRFLVLEGDAKMFDKDGNALTGTYKIDGLNENEMNFADNNNWVYQADIKAQPGCAVKLTAKYNSQVQYFIGEAGEGPSSRRTIIDGTSESPKRYSMRAVYDFKTNRLIVGWIPPEEEIDEDITLGGDILLIRTHQGDVQQIVFNQPATEVSDIQHIYGVLTLKKDTMIGKTNANYAQTMYWISFPFDVKLSEVFGTGIYGTDWIVQRYRGDLRAQKGWFKQETPTFWEYMEPTDTLKAYEGYVFLVDANKFNTDGAEAWKNSATEANFYFPSASDEIGIIHQDSYTQPVPEHECKIDREFEVDGVGTVNHMITDSHWNVIGVPAFQNNIPSASPKCDKFKSYYEWDHSTNKYKAEVVLQGTEFHTMHAYMVQFAGTITWSNVSVVKQDAPSRELAAQYADAQSYLITLRINDGKDDDQTYIRLSEKADAEFVLNEDMMKLDNTGFPNIYSFAGNYNVAYNETGMENQTINLGVNVPKNGNYTFSMPDNFNGSATLVDMVEGKVTELNVSDYTVTLNKGTYNNRFQLVLTVNSPIVTNVDEINNGWNTDGKTKKLLINNTIYLINGGHIYNASGMELSK